MTAWWQSLSLLQKIYGYVAFPATFVLLIQTVLVLFGLGGGGADADADVDADMDADGGDGEIALLSVRGFMAFFSVGGFAGMALDGIGTPVPLTVLISLAAGAAALYVTAMLFKWANRLQDSGNLSLQNAVGKTAKVYITIPAGRKRTGKVMVTFQERFAECDAVTAADEDIRPGTFVTVIGLEDENTLLVAPAAAQAAEE